MTNLYKKLFFATVLIVSQAHADFFFAQNDKIYSLQAKYSPEITVVDSARFLKIGVKQNLKNGTVSYKMNGIVSLKAFTLEKTPFAPKVVAGEGCSENPMSWLKSSKVIGQLKKKESAMFIQIPPQIKTISKANLKCPTDDRFPNGTPQLALGNKDFSVLVCSGDLNSNLLVLNANSIEGDIVITDNCP